MADNVDSITRSRMMATIRGKNTAPELLIRKALHARGFRFRIHAANLPGKPDVVLPKYQAAIFIHGCFWHGHPCRYFKVPKTRTEFWIDKIRKNQIRDEIQIHALNTSGWRVLVIWECAIRQMKKERSDFLIDRICNWLVKESDNAELEEIFLGSPCSQTD